MRSKILLFIGIIFLVTGILLKKIIQVEAFGLILIIIGVTFKFLYIIIKVKSGEYKPGKEILFLTIGLLLFFSGIYLKNTNQTVIKPIYLIISGITLKIIFIIKFIQIIKSNKQVNS